MLNIQCTANDGVMLTVTGRLTVENAGERSALLAAEPGDLAVMLDLKDLVIVDRETVGFLRACEAKGVALRTCPPYIREWITREGDRP